MRSHEEEGFEPESKHDADRRRCARELCSEGSSPELAQALHCESRLASEQASIQWHLVRLPTCGRQGVASKLPQRLPHLIGSNILSVHLWKVVRQEAANNLGLFVALLALQGLLQGAE